MKSATILEQFRFDGIGNSSWPGSSRPSTPYFLQYFQDVDARHKAGHDGLDVSVKTQITLASRFNIYRASDIRSRRCFSVIASEAKQSCMFGWPVFEQRVGSRSA
ncbi:MAG: hypothetical protein ACTHNN_19955 [Xanthobacteraceae bacterium]